ncbi:MAG: hypothetical protein PF495_07880, partial [Spirochaetales bacterium]|nr:hypothetical protein [Spirochaetales bacterium]
VPSVLFVGFFIQKTLQKLHRDEYFGGKRNEASGTLWTDTILLINPLIILAISTASVSRISNLVSSQ